MKRVLYAFWMMALLLSAATGSYAQVAVNTDGTAPHASAMLDVKSTTKGFLLPRLTTAQRTTLGASATAGLVVYDTDLGKLYFHNGTTWNEGGVGTYWNKSGSNIFQATLTDNVGIGTMTPARRLEVYSGAEYRALRLNSTSSGAVIEFMSGSSIDWNVGTWGNVLRFATSTDDFASVTDQYYITQDEFSPFATAAKSSGASSRRWSKLYSVDGDFSGSVGIGTTSPVRKLHVHSTDWHAVRISTDYSSSAGPRIELVGDVTTDWAITSYNNAFYLESSDNDFIASETQLYVSKTVFQPWTNNTKSLGSSTQRWSTTYSIDGNFSEDVTVSGDLNTGSIVPTGNTLDIKGSGNPYVYILSNALNEDAILHIGEFSHDYGLYWLYDGGEDALKLFGQSSSGSHGPHWTVYRNSGNMTFAGNLALGTEFASGYRLSVDGKIICEEARVRMSEDWPDYVFGKEYNLLPVEKLESFIDANGHLPNIPPASEIEASGVDLGEMQRLMMEKIEELSLYIIEQQKRMTDQQSQIDDLKHQIAKLQEK